MWKWRLKQECHTCRRALCLPGIPSLYLAQVIPHHLATFQAHGEPSDHTVPLAVLFYWSGTCYSLYPPQTTSLLVWNSTFYSRPWRLNESIPSTIFSEHIVYFAPRALIYPALLLVAYLPITYRKKNERTASQTALCYPCVFKQCLEHSRHSINVSYRVKVGNSGTTTATFISKEELFPKELGSIFAHSYFWKDFSDSLAPLQEGNGAIFLFRNQRFK